jgi:hypothetical protein
MAMRRNTDQASQPREHQDGTPGAGVPITNIGGCRTAGETATLATSRQQTLEETSKDAAADGRSGALSDGLIANSEARGGTGAVQPDSAGAPPAAVVGG